MEKIGVLPEWQTSPLFSDEEKLALEYAEAVTITGSYVNYGLLQRLKEEWSDDMIVELTGLIAFQDLSSKFNSALDIPAQGFCLKQPNKPTTASFNPH